MRILCNGVFPKKNPSQHLFWKGAELKSTRVCSYKSSCSGNLRWCCHLSHNLEKWSLERETTRCLGTFRFFSKCHFDIWNVDMFIKQMDRYSKCLWIYNQAPEEYAALKVISWNWTEPWWNIVACVRTENKETASNYMPI